MKEILQDVVFFVIFAYLLVFPGLLLAVIIGALRELRTFNKNRKRKDE